MAHIAKIGQKWRAEVCIDWKRRAKTFPTKREAVAWANEQEEDGILAQHTLRECIERYRPIAEARKGKQAELSRLAVLSDSEKTPFVDLPLEYITPAMIADWRDKRLKKMAPVSVRREMIILGTMLKLAMNEWHWLKKNPVSTVKKPTAGAARRRGITQAEITAICSALASMRVGKQVSDMFLLSIETGMRLGEMVSLKWTEVADKYVTLLDTKNGDKRHVPLSSKARAIIEGRKNLDPESVFTLNAHVVSTSFRRARDAANCRDVHFHDARSEAITRLSKKLDVLQLARMIGHRDIKSLMFYYAESAESMADRLG